ncbi:MAG: PilZ domain-containing protein [bacterium]|nr:PilZ domain-containing protein [bacterium]
MLSVKAIYEDGKILLKEPVELADNTEVILTFLDGDYPGRSGSSRGESTEELEVASSAHGEAKDDAYYERMRAHKRFKAKGNITIVEESEETDYPLNDYSAGGLSFFADKMFNQMEIISARIKYRAAGEVLELDFDIRVMRCIDKGDQFMIGCQFLDGADEELWHTIMS